MDNIQHVIESSYETIPLKHPSLMLIRLSFLSRNAYSFLKSCFIHSQVWSRQMLFFNTGVMHGRLNSNWRERTFYGVLVPQQQVDVVHTSNVR